MTNKLLPCPFCGGTDVHLRHLASASMSWVSCAGCGLEAPSETGVTDDAAVAYWNRRAAEITRLQKELDTAREALEPFAEEATCYDPDDGDGDDTCWATPTRFKIRDLRRAREVYRALKDKEVADVR